MLLRSQFFLGAAAFCFVLGWMSHGLYDLAGTSVAGGKVFSRVVTSRAFTSSSTASESEATKLKTSSSTSSSVSSSSSSTLTSASISRVSIYSARGFSNESCLEMWKQYSENLTPNPNPPHRPPPELEPEFHMRGASEIQYQYAKNVYLGGSADVPVWGKDYVEQLMKDAKLQVDGDFSKNYGNYPPETRHVVYAVRPYVDRIAGKRGLVVGSENPWAEALLLAFGVSHVTTLEFGKIKSEHPRISTVTPMELIKLVVDGEGKNVVFDFIFSYSSLEHDGLGRYGDQLNPYGDIESMQRLKCLLKSGGLFFLGVPFGAIDCTVFNMHRIYGPKRQELMFRGYKLHKIFGDEWRSTPRCHSFQRVAVLEKPVD